jgi:superfamily II DNA or RNA helicase
MPRDNDPWATPKSTKISKESQGKPIKIFARDGLLIPLKKVSEEQHDKIQRKFEKDVYKDEGTCEKCDYFSERPSDVCDQCPNYEGKTIMHKVVTRPNGKDYVKLPYGSERYLTKIFGAHEVIQKNVEIPMKRPIKFIGKLRENQVDACKAMVTFEHGVLKSPPRSGKTVMGSWFIAKKSQKTIILAAQKDWLDNFYETLVGSEDEPPMTDIKKKRIGFPKTLEDFEKYDVSLCTYQKFLSPKGKKLLNKIKGMFSVLMVDEIQTAGAKELSSIINTFHARYKFGLSGTPERKDSKEYIIYNLVGPVFYENKVEQLRPRLVLKETPPLPKLPQSWTYMINKLEKDPKRLKMIAEEAIADVKAKHLVLIPMTRVVVIKALVKAINQMYGKNIAGAFYGGMGSKEFRKEFINKARKYKIKVVVGISKLLSTGINIPRASMLYQVSPSSNIPKAQQRFARVLTPFEGKPQPVFKYFVDDADVVRACMRKEHWQCVVPRFRPMMTGETKEQLEAYFKGKKIDKSGYYDNIADRNKL